MIEKNETILIHASMLEKYKYNAGEKILHAHTRKGAWSGSGLVKFGWGKGQDVAQFGEWERPSRGSRKPCDAGGRTNCKQKGRLNNNFCQIKRNGERKI